MEHGKLHIPVNGVDVDFYPETCFDDVIDTGTDLTLTQTLASVNQSITAEATARANADAALDDKIALKVATSTYDAKMLRLDESISSLSTNKLDASTYNTKMASLDESIATNTSAISGLSNGKLDKTGGYISGTLTVAGSITRTVDNGLLVLRGATGYENGATIALYGMKEPTHAGKIRLIAKDATSEKVLSLEPSGELTWAGKNIVTEKNHYYIQCGANATITIDYSSYSACVIRYARGSNTNGIILFDTWAGVGYISQTSSNKPTISMSTKKITFTNNYSSGAVSICVDMY